MFFHAIFHGIHHGSIDLAGDESDLKVLVLVDINPFEITGALGTCADALFVIPLGNFLLKAQEPSFALLHNRAVFPVINDLSHYHRQVDEHVESDHDDE